MDGRQENIETVKLRDKILQYIKPSYRVITDRDEETLGQHLRRIGPGTASVVLEIHFDSANGKATGTTSLYMTVAPKKSIIFAAELTHLVSSNLNITNRGAKSEVESARRRLGLTHENEITALLEICFIDNTTNILIRIS